MLYKYSFINYYLIVIDFELATPLKTVHRRVEVPRPDDETFTSFFKPLIANGTSHNTSSIHNETFTITSDDLDSVQRVSGDLLASRRTVRVQRKHEARKNPLKVLKERVDIREEYTEIITGVAEREKKRIHVEKCKSHK